MSQVRQQVPPPAARTASVLTSSVASPQNAYPTTDHVIKENTFTGNNVGVLLFGSRDSTVKENILSASVLAGIRINVLATGNLIIENTVISNPAGILFNPGATGNSVVENSIELNTCGLKGPTAGNTFKENLFAGHGADTCL